MADEQTIFVPYQNSPMQQLEEKSSAANAPVGKYGNVVIPQQEIKKHSEKFEVLVSKSEKVLLHVKAVFPFDFFPDEVLIDENKVNIIHHMFFYSQEVQSIIIQHIKDVIVDTSLFFATLKILPDGYNENWVSVSYLKRKDALGAKEIIAGLLVGFKEGVDITKVETPNLVQKIQTLGAAT